MESESTPETGESMMKKIAIATYGALVFSGIALYWKATAVRVHSESCYVLDDLDETPEWHGLLAEQLES